MIVLRSHIGRQKGGHMGYKELGLPPLESWFSKESSTQAHKRLTAQPNSYQMPNIQPQFGSGFLSDREVDNLSSFLS